MATLSPVPPDNELDDLARTHVQYEVGVLVGQACEFHRRYPSGWPGTGGFREPDVDDALIEAVLVHVRLLDDFLKSERFPSDVKAEWWVPDWAPTPAWLDPNVRKLIDKQVAHLDRSRATSYAWDVRGYAYACCQEIDSFVNAVKRHNAARHPPFSVIEQRIARGRSELAP